MQLTQGGAPQHNGGGERHNRSLLEISPSSLDSLRGKLLHTACHIQNRIPGKSTPLSSPHELFSGKKPNLAHLRTIGYTIHVHVPATKRMKLSTHAHKCALIDYDTKTKAYRCYDPLIRKIRIIIMQDLIA